jgi:hypothetical protein
MLFFQFFAKMFLEFRTIISKNIMYPIKKLHKTYGLMESKMYLALCNQ